MLRMAIKHLSQGLFHLIFRFLPYCLIIIAIVIVKPALESLRASAESLECYCPSCPENLLPEAGLQALGKIKAEIAGAVHKPGIYELDLGQRRADLLAAAGGLDQKASLVFIAKTFNLSSLLSDGEKIYIPYAWEETWQLQKNNSSETLAGENAGNSSTQASTNSSTTLISINEAVAKELESLPSIGEKRASDIINNRPYNSVNELVDKDIISESIYEEIKNLVSL